jgi:hypothetical protein
VGRVLWLKADDGPQNESSPIRGQRGLRRQSGSIRVAAAAMPSRRRSGQQPILVDSAIGGLPAVAIRRQRRLADQRHGQSSGLRPSRGPYWPLGARRRTAAAGR